MSYSVMVTLSCDVCNTEADSSDWTVCEARITGRGDGWHFAKGRDICENCWDEGER